MMLHLFDFFRRMLQIQAATPEPTPKPLRKPRAKKTAPKKAPASKKK